jgi:hypothetical protein
LDTVSLSPIGKTVYVSAKEFQQICAGLLKLNIAWQVSSNQEVFQDAMTLHPVDSMTVSVVTTHGTARGNIDPEKLCSTLASLDSAFSSRYALWEFQSLRREYYCKVPGFRLDAFAE